MLVQKARMYVSLLERNERKFLGTSVRFPIERKHLRFLEDFFSMNTARKSRDWFLICSWIILIVVFAALVVFMSVHVKDLLDADMSSELVLGKLLKESGGILSHQWYYSTELRVLNTQLVYSFFFHVTNDWQTVRILGNVTLYLILLGSYFFLCKRVGIARYFPLSAAVLLLPLSAPYFYVLLYGAYYIPRVSLTFIILGCLLPIAGETKRKVGSIVFGLLAVPLSLALGLEGARMLVVLFMPLAALVGAETLVRLFLRRGQPWQEHLHALRQDKFLPYFGLSFFACLAAVAEYFINRYLLISIYPFEPYGGMTIKMTLGTIKRTVFYQLNLIGNSTWTTILSLAIWLFIAALFVWYIVRKGEKSLPKLRFIWLNILSWASYTLFGCIVSFGQTVWHMVPVAVLFIPGVAIVLSELPMKPVLRRVIAVGLSACFLFLGILGYSMFARWTNRDAVRTSEAYTQMTDVLLKNGYRNGYATFWSANNLTELSDGAIDMWCVKEFDKDTIDNPDIYQWLQDKSHDTERPSGKIFVVWTMDEFAQYGKQEFPYLGEIVFQDDTFVVFDVAE